MKYTSRHDVLANFGTGIVSNPDPKSEMLAEILIRLERIEAMLRASNITERPRCTSPGCAIVDPPNGGHSHPNWDVGPGRGGSTPSGGSEHG